ncbi:MAG: DUF1295 domain-containing protein [Phycisphaeraceae bacterium]|nr:MAG: DUF1295 domain-containing protein [Phycisphaeraceae bacterium]
MTDSPWILLAVAWAAAAVFLSLLWLHQVRTKNATLVDVGWTLALAGAGVFYAVVGGVGGEDAGGSFASRAAALAMALVWGTRLTAHLVLDRVVGSRPEDARYRALREHWGDKAQPGFFVVYQLQALAAVLLSWPFLLIASDPSPSLSPLTMVGLALFALALTTETIADRQLASFRADPANRGRTCRRGLWRYSRHPNYFFEWLVWVALALAATDSRPEGTAAWWGRESGWEWVWGASAWLAPLAMLVLVTKVSGIPWAEAQSLRSRGDDYRRYQRETSAFFPWFTRSP